ncbi:MAG: hypothetical protein EOO22_08475 [Comamonadaceae bacterium]|nr:MAG: hypothetical protein EOO22_08475 [Comamonadaceae bacterium]
MSISRLREVAGQKLPLNVFDADELDELRVLMEAGLIVALRVRVPSDHDGGTSLQIIRVLAITPDGRRLLARCPTSEFAPPEPYRSSAVR